MQCEEEGLRLLELAHSLGLHVAGVSFHVGSGCKDPCAYASAIQDAEHLFLAASSKGIPPMTVLDLGEAFPEISKVLQQWRDALFRVASRDHKGRCGQFEASLGIQWSKSMRYIAEPGRFFVSASTTLATRIYSVKKLNM